MKLRKMKNVLLMVIGAALIVSGCGAGKDSAQGGKTRVRFATWDSEEGLALQQGLVDQYNEQNSDVEIVLEAYGDEYDTKIAAGMGAKDAPDVMYMWNYPLYKDALEPLDSYIDNEGTEFKDNFYEALWEYNSGDGNVYGLPVGYTTHVVYYNKDLFDAKGIDYPKVGWTWDDLEKIAGQVSDKENNVTGLVFSGKPDPYDFEMYLWGNGASFSDKEGNISGQLNSPESIEVFEMFQNMLKKDIAVATEGSGFREMKSGNAAMFVYGTWGLGELSKAGINYGVVELPEFGKGKSVSIVNFSGVAMSKDSKNKAEAFDFIKYWAGEEGNIARMEHDLPALKSVVESQRLAEDPIRSVFYTMLEQSNGYTPTSYIVEDWSVLSESLNYAFEHIFNPSTLSDPAEVLNEAAQ